MSKFTHLIRSAQLMSLGRRAARFQQAGEPVPFGLQICIALAKNRIPDPIRDNRELVDPRKIIRPLHPGTKGGRQVKMTATPSNSDKLGSPKSQGLASVPPVHPKGFVGWWRRVGRPLGEGPKDRRELSSVASRAYHWRKLARPITVSTEDWELLRLAMVEDLTAPEIRAKLGGSVTLAAVYKRLERAQAASLVHN